jgi:hypothetical protein
MEPRFGHDFSDVSSHASTPSPQSKLTINQPGDRFEQEADRVAGQVMSTTAPATQENGYDFSGVRVHTDERAAESARTVGALAYTVGHHVVFGAEQFALGAISGKRLLAHELVHVAQQASNLQALGIQRQTPQLQDYENYKANKKITNEKYAQDFMVGKVNPYPGCKIEWDLNKQVLINVDFQLIGTDADAQKAQKIQESINKFWNITWKTPVGDFNLITNVTVTYTSRPTYLKNAVIELYKLKGKRSTIFKFGIGYPQNRKMAINLEDGDLEWTSAHEFGHYLGLDDRYTDKKAEGDKTVSVSMPGWENTIMGAESGGTVNIWTILELIAWWANWAK